jgi:hypothetical protein
MAKVANFPPGGHPKSGPLSKTIHSVEPHSEAKLKQPFGQKDREEESLEKREKQGAIPFRDGSR